MPRGTGGVVEWYVACCNAAESDGGAGLTMTATRVWESELGFGFWVGTNWFNWMTYLYIRKIIG